MIESGIYRIMKRWIVSFIFSIFVFVSLQAQTVGMPEGISFSSDCGEIKLSDFHGSTLCVIRGTKKDDAFGKVAFVPSGGGYPWKFTWTFNGTPQIVSMEDTVSLEVDLSIYGSGHYVFRAEKDGKEEVADFHVFFDYVGEFHISLSDLTNCHAVTIDAITDFIPPVYVNEGYSFEGNGKVYYLLPEKTVPLEFSNYETAFMARQEGMLVDENNRENVTVTITDRFGFEWMSEPVRYESVIPKAEMELELGNKVDVVGEVNDEMGQAPLEVAFRNRSVNADSWEWLLYRDTLVLENVFGNLKDSLLDGIIRTDFELLYTYEHSGRYKVVMMAENAISGCRDTTEVDYVNVVESLLEVPNVFTPNGDGKNDVFMVKGLSLENFHAVILNRWGRQVYEWSDPSGGWDGRINGKYATPGTYFYVITARGRERINPPEYIKKGALMLIR